ncbi:sphingosine N-acyltransferase lag1 [Coniosporium tulheliwenetii]|uniref:Sphingosine N-acyltransferase lag1 n=1 Tax=Coniosporium tulheliwenetii TaxID=3383036 RepID=A0ACC2YUP8_9PEZI|nr:sphingosine N-acyltransferase lag1 [Cladosporium sp. JES 115]
MPPKNDGGGGPPSICQRTPGRHRDNITSNLSRHITLYHLRSVGEAIPTSNLGTERRTSSEKTPRRSKRRKVKSFFRRWKSISLRHTWLNPLLICLLVGSLYLINPSPANPVSAALFLSYPLPRAPDADPTAPTMYGKAAAAPLAIRFHIPSRAKQSRFMEQLYTAIYFAVFGPLGLYVMSLTPVWYFNTRAFYEGFPHRELLGIFKAYYLLQAAYWSQQMIVLLLMLEKPRKDFRELVGHHVITLALIYLSYRFHFTYMGLAVYITHDISDFFLAVILQNSKLPLFPLVGPYFGLFILVWTYLRHHINLHILYSILTEYSTIGPFELNWETEQYKCRLAQWITFALLACLQAVNLFWLGLIIKIAVRFVTSKEAVDERSEEEDEGELSKGEREEGVAVEEDEGDVAANANGRPKATANGKSSANGPTVLLNGEPVGDEMPMDAAVEGPIRQRRKSSMNTGAGKGSG